MLKDEAEHIVGSSLSEEEYGLLNMVYTFHPLVTTKDALGKMFDVGGWHMIRLLLPEARVLAELEREKVLLRSKINDIERKQRDIEILILKCVSEEVE